MRWSVLNTISAKRICHSGRRMHGRAILGLHALMQGGPLPDIRKLLQQLSWACYSKYSSMHVKHSRLTCSKAHHPQLVPLLDVPLHSMYCAITACLCLNLLPWLHQLRQKLHDNQAAWHPPDSTSTTAVACSTLCMTMHTT